MFCKRWSPDELLPVAESLAAIFMEYKLIDGVALTGSLARLEKKIHDIDFILFHDGRLSDSSSQEPERDEHFYSDDVPLINQLYYSYDLYRSITRARGGVPLNCVFVHEKVLWDCQYLHSLEAKERFKDFYIRVFCDIPLVLFRPDECRGALREHVAKNPNRIWLGETLPGVGREYLGANIRHTCDEAALRECRPKQSWEECRREIKRRKGHWWHPFMSLIWR